MSKTKIGGKKLIIQFGRDETLFALWDKGPSFSHTLSLPTPAGAVEDGDILNIDAVRDLLNTALGTPELKNVRNVVFALCTSQVISETISVPEMSQKKLDKLIHANVDMYFPVDMTDYRLVWQTIGPKTGTGGMKEQSVQLWAVPNAMLAPYYAIANECGLSVSAIDYCGNSIATAVGASFSTKKKARPKLDLNAEISFGRKKKASADEAVIETNAASEAASAAMTDLHLTLDKELIGITFVQNGLVVHQRFVRCGSNPAYQFDEVAMMVEYFRSLDIGRSSEFNAMVSGPLAEDPALVDELSFALDMPLPVFSSDVDPRWIVCAGAARTVLDFGNSELDNPVRSVSPKANQLAQTAVLTAGAAALAGVVALTFVARFSWNATIESLESKRQTLAIQLQKVAGYADKYNEYSTLYDNYSSDWNVVFNNLRTYNDNLVRLLEELEDILPRKASVTAMTINADGLEVQFACDKKEDAAYLIMALRELQYADLNAISSLSGGGRGPANTYGNGEKAPTEGSDWLAIEQRDALANSLLSDWGVFDIL
ncbi:MAG: pilus assembly protein PilM, partial [Oscillospiraceae bacterium]|nr:pilus assembly protein PilM [Oscillospiraceae bacterium]